MDVGASFSRYLNIIGPIYHTALVLLKSVGYFLDLYKGWVRV